MPADVTEEERATAKREIGKYTKILGEEPRVIRFAGRTIGQTGPVWHFQYTRLYELPKGYLVAAHDLHEGIKVAYAERPDPLSRAPRQTRSVSTTSAAVRVNRDRPLRRRRTGHITVHP